MFRASLFKVYKVSDLRKETISQRTRVRRTEDFA